MKEEEKEKDEEKEEEKYSKSFLIKTVAAASTLTLIVAMVTSMLFFHSYFDSKYSEYGDLLKIKNVVDKNYLDDVDRQKMIDSACEGYVYGLGDPYAKYYPEKDYQLLINSLSSQYIGIGITVSENDEGNLLVNEVAANSPAENAGVLSGDIITHVNNISVSGIGSVNALDIIKKGNEGDTVSLTIMRNEQKLNVSMKLAELYNYTINYEFLDNSVAYIKISNFNTDTPDAFSEALKMAEEDGAGKIILDLRNNPGGESEATRKIADELLEDCVIYYSVDKNGKKEYVRAKSGSCDLPMAVLVNGSSASAAELLTGALKDNGRAYIIGEKTYGKGVIQGLYNITDSTAVKFTVAEYYTPNNVKVNGVGITPDYEVELNPDAVMGDYTNDNQLKAALQYLNGGSFE